MEIQKIKGALDWLNKNGYMPEDWETVEYIISVLEKQIPKEPVEDKYGHKCCPACGWVILLNGVQEERFTPHCENCGQAMDWTDN